MSKPDPYKTHAERRATVEEEIDAMLDAAAGDSPVVRADLAVSRVVALCRVALDQALKQRDRARLDAELGERRVERAEHQVQTWYEAARAHHKKKVEYRYALFAILQILEGQDWSPHRDSILAIVDETLAREGKARMARAYKEWLKRPQRTLRKPNTMAEVLGVPA